jgi:hypothetical protein
VVGGYGKAHDGDQASLQTLDITADNPFPDFERLIANDVSFMLGDLHGQSICNESEAITSDPRLSHVFCSFVKGQENFSSGCHYIKNYKLTEKGPKPISPLETIDTKIKRNCNTIYRDFSKLIDGDLYCYNTQDAQTLIYDDVFGRDHGRVAVIQYHRLRGQSAAIFPLQGYHKFPSHNIPDFIDKTRFREKQSKVVWRGSPNGSCPTPAGFIGIPRILANHSLSIEEKTKALRNSGRFRCVHDCYDSDFIDVGFVLNDRHRSLPASSILRNLERGRMSPQQQTSSRYILALDGYDGPSNMYWILRTNSLMFRQNSSWEMFGDNYFLPWVHFVPVEATASDIEEKFHWCERNISECERIVSNARAAWACLFDQRAYNERIRQAAIALHTHRKRRG